jgi:Flp pilus assembly protein TadD
VGGGDPVALFYWCMVAFFLLTSLLFADPDLLSGGRAAMEHGEYAQAERLFREQIAKTPHSAEALSNLGAVLAREDKLEEAVATYKKALAADPKLDAIYLNLGIAYFRAGRFEESASPLEQFLKTHPDELRARKMHSIALVESGHYKSGIAELDRLNIDKPNDPSILFALASAQVRAGDENRGKELLKQLEDMHLAPVPVHLLQGMLLYRSELYDEAERELQEALKLDPKSAPTLAALGRLRLRVNDDPAAIDLLERALAIQPQDAESNYQLGVLLSRNNQEDRGREYLKRAIEQRANYPDPMYFLGKLELSQNHDAAAVKYLEGASRLAPHQENITFLLARAYKQAGREDQAKSALAEFRRLQSERLKRDRAAINRAADPEGPLDPSVPVSEVPQ